MDPDASRISKFTIEQKKKKLAANRAKALQKKHELMRKTNGGVKELSTPPNGTSAPSLSAGGPAASGVDGNSSRNAEESKKQKYRKMIRKSDYIQYDISTTQDTKGGFLVEPQRENGEKNTLEDWREKQRLNKEFLVRDPPPPEDIANAPKCFECGTIDINQEFYKVYRCRVCNRCKEKFPDKYSLLTKTECKLDYFLTEPELMDTTIFNKIEKPNPHAKFSRMQLYLRYQIEEFAFKKWGGTDGLDEEWLRRQKQKMDKKNKRFETKLLEMKKRTRAEEYTRKLRERANDGYGHTHDWSEPIQVNGTVTKRRCVDCGLETEEISF